MPQAKVMTAAIGLVVELGDVLAELVGEARSGGQEVGAGEFLGGGEVAEPGAVVAVEVAAGHGVPQVVLWPMVFTW
jgi:hypothetical protein